MDDLISRQVLLAEQFASLECILQANKDANFDVYKRGWNDALQTVYDNAPSAQKKGHWIDASTTREQKWKCSECDEETTSSAMGLPRYRFCPMCGADMRKEGKTNV